MDEKKGENTGVTKQFKYKGSLFKRKSPQHLSTIQTQGCR